MLVLALLGLISSSFLFANARYVTINNPQVPGGKYTIITDANDNLEKESQSHRNLKKEKLHDYDRKRDIEERIPYYPLEQEAAPFTKHNKVLGMVLAYGFDHMDPFMLHLLPEYVSMCEAGWDPSMIILTAASWTPLLRRMFVERVYCTRLERSVKIEWAVYHKNISTWLAGEHRHYMADRLNDYDVFMYHEDDIPFRASHLTAYVKATHDLKHRLPWTGLYDYTIGFQRFRHIHRINLQDAWGEQDIVEQDLLEETPTFEQTCVPGEDPDLAVDPWTAPRGVAGSGTSPGPGKMAAAAAAPPPAGTKLRTEEQRNRRRTSATHGPRQLESGDWEKKTEYPYIIVIGNTHQGAFMLTQEQVKILHIKCKFLNHSSGSREYMSSFSLFDNKYYHCGLQKLIPAERLNSFYIHHFYHTKWVSWFTNTAVNDKVRSGQHYQFKGNLSNPGCWRSITTNMVNVLEQQETLKQAEKNWYDVDPVPADVIPYMPMDVLHGYWR